MNMMNNTNDKHIVFAFINSIFTSVLALLYLRESIIIVRIYRRVDYNNTENKIILLLCWKAVMATINHEPV